MSLSAPLFSVTTASGPQLWITQLEPWILKTSQFYKWMQKSKLFSILKGRYSFLEWKITISRNKLLDWMEDNQFSQCHNRWSSKYSSNNSRLHRDRTQFSLQRVGKVERFLNLQWICIAQATQPLQKKVQRNKIIRLVVSQAWCKSMRLNLTAFAKKTTRFGWSKT